MAKRIAAVVSQGQSANPVKRQLEEDIVAGKADAIQVIFDCCHATPCYAILPTNEPLDQEKVVARVQKL